MPKVDYRRAPPSRSPLPVFVARDPEEVADHIAEEIAELVRRRPDCVLGLASGHTPVGVYEHLVELHRAGLELGSVRTFNLDVYEGQSSEESWSFRGFMRRVLFEPAGFSPGRTHFPARRCAQESPEAAALRFEAELSEAGGVDLQLLGIGRNGHIGFNEPGSDPASRTGRVALLEETRRVNAADPPSGVEVPPHAITMGVATLLEAKVLRVLALGAEKAEITWRVLHEPISPLLPATFLLRHPSIELWLDEAAAARL